MDTIFLPLNRAIIGPKLAAELFVACREAAHRIDPDCTIIARYLDYERVGWSFTMRDAEAVDRLRVYYLGIMARSAWRFAPAAPVGLS